MLSRYSCIASNMNKFSKTLLGLLVSFVSLMQPSSADIWPCCYYNGKEIGCRISFEDLGQSLYIEWEDGVKESYEMIRENAYHGKTYKDVRGGIWESWLGPQGNVLLTNPANGNEIFIPLRGCAG